MDKSAINLMKNKKISDQIETKHEQLEVDKRRSIGVANNNIKNCHIDVGVG